MRALSLFMIAFATTAGYVSANVLRAPSRRTMQLSQSHSSEVINSLKSTTQKSLDVDELRVDHRGALTKNLFLTPTRYTIPIRKTVNSQYACNISFGMPPRELEVVLDTGSSRLWLPDIQCDNDDPENHICRDVLRIGSLIVKNQLFAGAGALPGVNISVDGYLGLGHDKSTDSPFYNMVHQGLLDEPIFALHLGDNDHNDSEIVLGGTNKDHYDGSIVHLPVRRRSYWEVDLDTVYLGDKSIELDATGAIFDSGTPFIILPETLAQVLNRAVGATRGRNGRPFVDCNKRNDLPDLTFTLTGHNFSLTPSEYILQTESGCVSLLMGIDFPSPLGPVALLGTPFLKKWYSIYDLGKDTIGFAKAR